MNPVYPDYKKCGVSLANSVLKYFGAPTHHETLPQLDQLLRAKNYTNIVVLLTDGLGSHILDQHLPKDSFLQQHKVADLSAVFPPTTTAATTSIVSGLAPVEHGWLGWNNYIPDVDQVVTMFMNTPKDSETPFELNVSHKYFPYTNIFEQIRAVGDTAIHVTPYGGDITYEEHSLDQFVAGIKQACATPERKYVYGYYIEPDHTMHDFGTQAPETHAHILALDTAISQLSQELDNTLILVTADHGHRNLEYKFLEDYPKLYETLLRPTSIESRAANFFIKPGMQAQFIDEFHNNLPDSFILLTKEEVISQHLFGFGRENPRFRDCLGDFMAISLDKYAINETHEQHQLKSSHGGLTAEEMITPLIAIDC